MLRVWHVLLFVLALAAFGVAMAPASLAPQRPGVFTYGQASGSIWNGRFEDVQILGANAESAQWRLQPGALLSGEIAAVGSLSGGSLQGEVQMRRGLGGRRALSAETLRIEGLPGPGGARLAGLGLARDLDIAFANGRCVRAAGSVEGDWLARNEALFGVRGPTLRGEAQCVGDDAQIPLRGSEGGLDVDITVVLRADGGGEWRAQVRSAMAEAGIALQAAGFAPAPDGDGYVMNRTLQWLPL